MRLSIGAIVRQPINARAAPYHSCKNDSGGLAWPVTSETALENAEAGGTIYSSHSAKRPLVCS